MTICLYIRGYTVYFHFEKEQGSVNNKNVIGVEKNGLETLPTILYAMLEQHLHAQLHRQILKNKTANIICI